jgi:hypothetical protein
MDFRQNLQNVVNRTEAVTETATAGVTKVAKPGKGPKGPLWLTILSGVVLVGAVLLIVLAILSFTRNSGDSEASHVNKDLYQAVFLSNGQVYFGKINGLNSRYINMNDVFYLTQNSTSTTSSSSSTNTDYTLVKLGCQQIHYPKDQMIINRSQMTFWENLSNDGKVVKSIKEFQKQNPNGENCSTTTNGTQSTNSGTNATQNSTNTTNNSSTNSGQ